MHDARVLTWPEVKALAGRNAVALLPVGSTEAHGPHLPLSVDVIIAEAVCRRLAVRLEARGREVLQFPPLPYSLTDFAAAFAGTVSLSADTARALLENVLTGITAHGFREICVVNHHLEPAHFALVHEAARRVGEATSARIVVPDHRKRPHSVRLGEEFTSGGSHAGWYETSLMLAAAPELVREDVRLTLPELAVNLPAAIKAGAKDFHECGGPDAYFGAPAKASAEEGDRLLSLLAELSEAALLPPG